MLRTHSRTFEQIVRSLDVTMVALVTYVAAWTCTFEGGNGANGSRMLVDAALAGGAWMLVVDRFRTYQSRRTQRFFSELRSLLESTVSSLAIAALASSGLQGGLTFPPLIAIAVLCPLLVGERVVLRLVLNRARRRGWNTRRLVVVGSGVGAQEILARIDENDTFGIKVRGWVGKPREDEAAPFGDQDVPHLGTTDQLRQVLADECPDYVLLCPRGETRYAEVQQVFAVCDEAGVQCQYAPDHLTPKNLVPSISWIDDLPVYSFHAQRIGCWQLGIKRMMDFAFAGAAVLALLPVFVVCALAVKLGDGGPILFTQQRVGRRGRTFPCFKFRTMCVDAEAKLAAVAAMNEVDGPVFKIKGDPRITAVGRFLRRYSLDELPQLFNVLRGEMSIVGPRPPLPSEVKKYDWWQRRRISVRPGITCIWQVWGRNKVTFQRWMEMDMEYIDNWTLWRDCKIIMRTAFAVFRGTGQ